MPSCYRHLARSEGCRIDAFRKGGYSLWEIAKKVGVHHSSVGSVLIRNTGSKGYRYFQAQQMDERRRRLASKVPWKMALEPRQDIVSLIEGGRSPAQLSGRIRRFGRAMAGRQWIYESLRADRKGGGGLY